MKTTSKDDSLKISRAYRWVRAMNLKQSGINFSPVRFKLSAV